MKKKIAIFSGAGLDRESGVLTFRDCVDGLWNNHSIDEVATPSGWAKDREKVLKFYNERRQEMPVVHPNDGHKLIASLEEEYDVINVTQNVSDLLERGGATNVIHLHGELTKARGCIYSHKTSPLDHVIDIGYNDINIGDKCPVTGSQLRPHIVWFGEMPFGVEEGYNAIREADYLLIIGTSLNISYTLDMITATKKDCHVVYIDPEPSDFFLNFPIDVTYIEKGSSEGMVDFINILKTENICE